MNFVQTTKLPAENADRSRLSQMGLQPWVFTQQADAATSKLYMSASFNWGSGVCIVRPCGVYLKDLIPTRVKLQQPS